MSYVTDAYLDVTLRPKEVEVKEAKAMIIEVWVNTTRVFPDGRVAEIEVGKRFDVIVRVKNIGEGAGKLWAEIMYAETEETVPGGEAQVTTIDVAPGNTVSFRFTLTMPDYELALRINVGHVR